jgi:hypothetical protein
MYFKLDAKPPGAFGVKIFEQLPAFISKKAFTFGREYIFFSYSIRRVTMPPPLTGKSS